MFVHYFIIVLSTNLNLLCKQSICVPWFLRYTFYIPILLTTIFLLPLTIDNMFSFYWFRFFSAVSVLYLVFINSAFHCFVIEFWVYSIFVFFKMSRDVFWSMFFLFLFPGLSKFSWIEINLDPMHIFCPKSQWISVGFSLFCMLKHNA